MVTLTHFLEGNPLPPHRLLFSISSKGFIFNDAFNTFLLFYISDMVTDLLRR